MELIHTHVTVCKLCNHGMHSSQFTYVIITIFYYSIIFVVPDSVGGYSLFVSFVCLFVILSVCLSHLFLSHALTQKHLLWSVTQVWSTTGAY